MPSASGEELRARANHSLRSEKQNRHSVGRARVEYRRRGVGSDAATLTMRTPRASSPKAPGKLDLQDGPTKYVDRPANEGKHGDAAEEPNEGAPRADDEPETERHPKR